VNATEIFRSARQLLQDHRLDYDRAWREFRWPVLDRFNWALDWFDPYAEGNPRTAVHLIEEDGSEQRISYAELSLRSSRLAAFLRRKGCGRGDRILMMLPNSPPIWELMLAAMKVGAAVIPATTLLTAEDLAERLSRGRVRLVVADRAGAEKFGALGADCSRLVVGGPVPGWTDYPDTGDGPAQFLAHGETHANDPVLLYFTSGTTARPKLVVHTQASYPVGHLSTMYWTGLREGDVHVNVSSPGWGKHAWSNFFAPFNAGATVLVHNYARFNARRMLELLVAKEVTTLCAPPTVWRMLVHEELERFPVKLREVLSAGEPLNPEVMEKVKRAWGLTIRDGYGQTETTAQIGNTPGQLVKPGSMGRPLPGYRVELLDPNGEPAQEGEIALPLSPPPLGLMAGYEGDELLQAFATRGGHYRTGDIARRDADGYLTYVGRADDVFKSSDYRISPFELESALIEHEAVVEAAVVPSPDPMRGAVPKAFVILRADRLPDRALALDLFRFLRKRLAPFKRVRRLEFSDLPKTISGKIRRVELRELEQARRAAGERGPQEYWQEEFPELV
jgi:acetyl-CoA synthetase